jgi:hypothetical protein
MHVIDLGQQCAICQEKIGRGDSWHHDGENGEKHPFHSACIQQYAEIRASDSIPCPECREEVSPYSRWTRLVRCLRAGCCPEGWVVRAQAIGLISLGIVLAGGGGFVFSSFMAAGGAYAKFAPLGLGSLYLAHRVARRLVDDDREVSFITCGIQAMAGFTVFGLGVGSLAGSYLP